MDEFCGKVTKEKFAAGSKSEHDAIFLESDKGRFVLRRQGGNPFSDPELDKLVGKSICGHGVVTGYTLLLNDWDELDPQEK